MADTSLLKIVVEHIRSEILPNSFEGVSFEKKPLTLNWGGEISFDAVSKDGTIVGLISTSSLHTASGNKGTGKKNAILKDTLYLLNVKGVKQRFLAFTEISMKDEFAEMKKSGRFPDNIELIHTPLPKDLNEQVISVRTKASNEVSPR